MLSGFNLILLTAALLVGFEQPQIRSAHRLQRQLPVAISSDDQNITGRTINISETGALISLKSWSNLPDEVQIEVMGDSDARVVLTAKVIRVTPINETETHLGVDFVNLSRAQLDDLSLVMYSDVNEWYSQNRENADKPIASLGFLATSITRSLRELKPASTKKIRKQVNTTAQLYWDGHFFSGVATELGATSLRLELDSKKSLSSDNRLLGKKDLETMQNVKPLVGLLLSQNENSAPTRFVAEINLVQEERGKVSIELNFPEKFRNRQTPKIKQFLRNSLEDNFGKVA